MIINVSIKSKRTVGLPHIQSLVALVIKDEGVLANHPLSCHPQGVFGRWEIARKGKKMKKKKRSWKASAHNYVFSKEKNENPSTRFDFSLYSAQINKNTKIPSIPIIHEGQNWKKSQKGSQTGVNEAKTKNAGSIFAGCEIFVACQISSNAPFSLHFLLFFSSGF